MVSNSYYFSALIKQLYPNRALPQLPKAPILLSTVSYDWPSHVNLLFPNSTSFASFRTSLHILSASNSLPTSKPQIPPPPFSDLSPLQFQCNYECMLPFGTLTTFCLEPSLIWTCKLLNGRDHVLFSSFPLPSIMLDTAKCLLKEWLDRLRFKSHQRDGVSPP